MTTLLVTLSLAACTCSSLAIRWLIRARGVHISLPPGCAAAEGQRHEPSWRWLRAKPRVAMKSRLGSGRFHGYTNYLYIIDTLQIHTALCMYNVDQLQMILLYNDIALTLAHVKPLVEERLHQINKSSLSLDPAMM